MNFTTEQLVTLERALNCYAVTHVKNAAYNSHAASLDYVLGGGANGVVAAAKELLAMVGDELERRKTCTEANR